MFYILALLSVIVNGFIFVWQFLKKNQRKKLDKAVFLGAIASCFVGIVGLITVIIASQSATNSLSSNYILSWVGDIWDMFLKISLIFTLVVGLLVAVSSFAESSKRIKLRASLVFVSSVVVLLVGLLCLSFAENSFASISIHIELSSFFISLMWPVFILKDIKNKIKK